jgi:hypothetical protein
MSYDGAPSGRANATAVWTGSRMLVWGGQGTAIQGDGRVYDPGADSWTPMAAAGAPMGRVGATAVWTGGSMLVWGGSAPPYHVVSAGGRYVVGDNDRDGVADACETGVALADANGSGRVDGFDLAALGRSFGGTILDASFEPGVDFDRDTRVDGDDLAVLAASWGEQVAP